MASTRPPDSDAFARPLAFVLPGGGALGAYEAGAVLALAEAGVHPDLLVGVSAGAINAAFLAWHPGLEGAHALVSLWQTIRRRDVMPVRLRTFFKGVIGRRSSLATSERLRELLDGHMAGLQLEDAPVPVGVMATDFATGEAVLLRRGSVTSALLASCALPAIYPPVDHEGRRLVDGGIANDLPLDVARDLGARAAVVIPVPPPDPDALPTGAIDILQYATSLGIEAHNRTKLAQSWPGLSVHQIPADPTTATSLDFARAGELARAGRARTAAFLRAQRSALRAAPAWGDLTA
jgi:NTE family protein